MMRKQSGLTMISWMLVLGLLAVQVVMGLRIVPVYLNHSAVVTVMDDLPKSSEIKGQTARKIMDLFRKRLKINNLYDLAKDKNAFKLKQIQGGFLLIADYEVRGPIWGNLEFVASFKHQVEVLTK